MLLVIDVGNSHTVLGLYEGETVRGHWRLVTSSRRTADELQIVLSALLRQENIEPSAVHACCISSVVPAVNGVLEELCRNAFRVTPLFVGPGVRTGLVIQVENPKEVGADRIVNAVGALESYPGPLIVVDFGTATTFDAITARAEYRGGVIVPGIQISADALFERCAKLPRVEIVKPPQVIGRDTVSHIRAGLTYGYADLVDGLIDRIAAEMAADSASGHDQRPTVIATGGFAPIIAELAKRIDHVDAFLTLKGLRAIYARNAKEGE